MYILFCFFKQKTAYEMRISDWSSDVCSSDLPVQLHHVQQFVDLGCDLAFVRTLVPGLHAQAEGDVVEHGHVTEQGVVLEHETNVAITHIVAGYVQIGRASCRERVCQYV